VNLGSISLSYGKEHLSRAYDSADFVTERNREAIEDEEVSRAGYVAGSFLQIGTVQIKKETGSAVESAFRRVTLKPQS